MSPLRLSSLILSVALLGCPIAVAAQPEIQHLTCTKDSQGLMCTIDETQETVVLKHASQPEIFKGNSASQLGELSNFLIGLIFIGFPITIVLSVLIHDKRDDAKLKQIEELERIWQQS